VVSTVRRSASRRGETEVGRCKTSPGSHLGPRPFGRRRSRRRRGARQVVALAVLLAIIGLSGAAELQWIGRLLTETPPMTLKEARWVIAMVEQLPRCKESLSRIAQRR
jgi:hypothetical protein